LPPIGVAQEAPFYGDGGVGHRGVEGSEGGSDATAVSDSEARRVPPSEEEGAEGRGMQRTARHQRRNIAAWNPCQKSVEVWRWRCHTRRRRIAKKIHASVWAPPPKIGSSRGMDQRLEPFCFVCRVPNHMGVWPLGQPHSQTPPPCSRFFFVLDAK